MSDPFASYALPSIPPAPQQSPLDEQIDHAASMTGVPFAIAKRLVQAESSGNSRAKSPVGAMGLTQLMPDTAKMLGVSDPYNPAENLAGGMKYLAQLHKQFGSWGHALAAYNWGPGNVQHWLANGGNLAHLPAETRAYIQKIAPDEVAALAQHPFRVAQATRKSHLQLLGDRTKGADPFAAYAHPQASPSPAPQADPGQQADTSFVPPPAQNLGDVLGWQQAAVLEGLFHQHNQDDNMKALRQHLGIEQFYEQNPEAAHTIFGPVVNHFLDAIHGGLNQIGRGTIDTALETVTDPLTAETFGLGPAVRGLKTVAGPLGRAAGTLGGKVAPQVLKDALKSARTVANAAKQGWHWFTQYAPEAKQAVGVGPTRAATAAGSRAARRFEEMNRRLQGLYAKATAGLSKADKSLVQQALNGQVPLARLTAEQKAAYAALRGLTDIAGPVLQHHPGGGSIAAISKFKPVGEPGAVRGTIQVAPRLDRLTVPILRRQLFDTLKQQGVSVADRKAAIQQVLGKTTLLKATPDDMVRLYNHFKIPVPAPKTGSRLLNRGYSAVKAETQPITKDESFGDWIARLRHETAATMQSHGTPAVLDRDLASPILKQPNYVKGPFGKMQRAPIVDGNRRLVGRAFELHPPQVPEPLQEFAGTPGEFTASNVRADYHPAKAYKNVVAENAPAKTVNPLESHNPHLISQAPLHIRPSQVDDFDAAFRGMLESTARHVTKNELRSKLGEIFGLEPQQVEKSLPREVFDLFTKQVPAKGSEREWKQILSEAWRGLVNLPKAAVVGASPFHMFSILKMMGVQDPKAVPEALVRFGRIVRAGKDPEKRWDALGREAAEYGLGTPLDDMKAWTTRVPVMKQMNRLTWDWDTAAALSIAKRLQRAGKIADPLEAGQTAREMLIDYDHRARAQELARYVAPFAQYNTAAPGVVLRGVAKAPLAAETINRATGGKYLGGGDQQSGEDYGPTGKVGRMINPEAIVAPGASGNRLPGVTSYVRSAMAEPVRAGLGIAGQKYFTYGQDPLSAPELLDEIASGLPLPYARMLLELSGLGPFGPHPLGSELIFSNTGYSPGSSP